jgi:hypothetical protein
MGCPGGLAESWRDAASAFAVSAILSCSLSCPLSQADIPSARVAAQQNLGPLNPLLTAPGSGWIPSKVRIASTMMASGASEGSPGYAPTQQTSSSCAGDHFSFAAASKFSWRTCTCPTTACCSLAWSVISSSIISSLAYSCGVSFRAMGGNISQMSKCQMANDNR